MRKILVAMSGGVDSAASAVLLRRQGYEVGGATMLLRDGGEEEAEQAHAAAQQLDLPFYLFEWKAEFERNVVAPFRQIYQAGRTPNPCVICNRTMKFGLFLEQALRLGYDGIATGHYARIEHSGERYLLRQARDRSKDQTYVLYSLRQSQLARTLFPMGEHTKQEGREQAEQARLTLAGKKDSQDICFVPDGDYLGYLTSRGMTPTPGHFYDRAGHDYGAHRGMEAYTIGQRRGLGVAAGQRIYVVEKRGGDVILGQPEELFSTRVAVTELNWIACVPPERPMRAQAKLRYTQTMADCTIHPEPDGVVLEFDRPQRAVTPGQAAVLYDGEYVLGGGTIDG